MSGTPLRKENRSMSSSWVDLSGQGGTTTPPLMVAPTSPVRVTPIPFGGELDYLRMLREAQKESNWSSNKVSPISSAVMSLSSTPMKGSTTSSPKSPPNSPNSERANVREEIRGVYINRIREHHHSGNGNNTGVPASSINVSDMMWDWNSRPNIPLREKKGALQSGSRSRMDSGCSSSKRTAKICKKSVFSREVVWTLVITNLLSLLIGTGIGIWLSKRGAGQCGCCGNLMEMSI